MAWLSPTIDRRNRRIFDIIGPGGKERKRLGHTPLSLPSQKIRRCLGDGVRFRKKLIPPDKDKKATCLISAADYIAP